MNNIELIKHMYALPRNTAAERGELLALISDDIEYVGIDKESARGRAAFERLFSKYEHSGQTDIKFKIKHIAQNGDTVLINMVDTVTVDGKTVDVDFSNVFKIRDGKIVFWQEHYNVAKLEAAFSKRIPVTEKAI